MYGFDSHRRVGSHVSVGAARNGPGGNSPETLRQVRAPQGHGLLCAVQPSVVLVLRRARGRAGRLVYNAP